ncbi:MAG: hypothetical protein WCR87_08075, partial [Saccharofermentanales bacterium]
GGCYLLNEAIFFQIIDMFPYPMVVYSPSYRVKMASRAFLEVVNHSEKLLDKDEELFNWHNAVDLQLVEASRKVFAGESNRLHNLKDPFSLFAGKTRQECAKSGIYNSAAVFPVMNDENEITHGVIVFLPNTCRKDTRRDEN